MVPPAYLKPSTMEPVPWAVLCPFAGRFQRGEFLVPTFPLQVIRSLCPSSVGLLGTGGPPPAHSLKMLPLQVCSPPGGNGTCKVTPHTLLLLLPASLHAPLGLDHLATQRDSARSTGDKLFSSNSPWQGHDKAAAFEDATVGQGSSVSTEVQP